LASHPVVAIWSIMSFWLAAALLTFLACTALLWPFRRGAGAAASGASDPHSHDVEVYRDQLRELDRDMQRGVIGAAEAQEARAEIGRRLLKAADGATVRSGGSRAGRIAASAAILSVPLVAWGGYALTGSPAIPDQRLAERLSRNPAENTVEELIARAEQHLAANPADGRGWEVLAPIYMRTGRTADAVTAWRNVIRLSGATAAREAGLGEALTADASGVVTADAEAAFGRALALDPNEPRARFFTGMALMQEGKQAEAAAAWQAMAQALPADSPWQAVVGRALASIAPEAAPAGPSADDMAAAQELAPQDREAMIEGMVASLDARLRENPADGEGWQRLVRSYAVLGRTEEAADALARGIAGLGAGTTAAAELVAFAAGIGITPKVTR
jgi:cytochrome c-type biogenesis protein CcmH